ncbi:methionine--tRNA ligase, cytoplasmic [Triticum urartu]|uniref:tRNA-binding domain-containing protein n=1 Tax=Triticum urartu TaxID=4572 RepID=A0A8R7VA88_TRIUA|nr:methionine--tRNA ligase, cytoplasmic [Triticum urartu]
MAAAAADFTQSKQAMSYALCKHLNLDPNSISSTLVKENDIASLFSHIVTSPQDEVKKWVEFSSNFVLTDGEQHALLGNLNQHLSQMSVLLAGFKPSAADIIVFATVHVFMCHLSDSELQKYPNILRWMDYIQNVVDFGTMLQKINLTKSIFNPPAPAPSHPKKADKGDGEPNSKKAVAGQKVADKSDGAADSKKAAGENKIPGDKANPASAKNNKPSGDKKKVQEKTAGKATEAAADKAPQKSAEKDSECSVSILNIQVGVIRKAWKHPSADSLLVEEIDLGDGNVRQVVSGLAKFFSPDELVNRHVVLITNVKPGKLRDVMSAGLVLCASNKDHTVVEPLIPPEGAKLGERISFAGFDGKPEDVLNPKKKQLDKITPHLRTDENGIATFRGVPFTTSAGPCRSSVPNADVK